MASRFPGPRMGAAGLLLLLAPALAAQDERAIPLDTVRVEVASRASARLGAATRAVETIGAEALRAAPAATVTDALRWAFGVDLMARSPALADVSVRGSSFEQVLVLVDGVRVRDGQTGHFNLDLAVPLDQVERVEVLRGPASALYGSDAMGGVVNVVTRRGAAGPAARLTGGSFGTATAALSHGARLGAVRADLAAEAQRSDGHRPGTDYETGSARLALSAPLAGASLEADLAHAARDFGADGFYGPYPSFERTRTTTASARWRPPVGRRVSVEPMLSVRRHHDDFVLRREDPAGYRNRHTTLQMGGEVVGRVALAPGVEVATGAYASRDRIESATLGDHREDRAALTAEVAAGAPGRLTATVGARADWQTGVSAFLSPSLSLAWWPMEAVRVRGSAGRAFRAPTWTDRYYRDPANVGDPDLAPERAWSAEAGVDAYPLPGLRLAAGVSIRDARDLIDWAKPVGAPDTEPWRTRNVQEARFRTLEAEVEATDPLGIRWTGQGSWTSLNATALPEYTSKYALRPLVETASLQAERALAGGLSLTARAARARRAGEDPYLHLDGRASYRRAGAAVFLDVRNALDERSLDAIGMPAPGRSLAVGLEWRGAR